MKEILPDQSAQEIQVKLLKVKPVRALCENENPFKEVNEIFI